MGIVFTRIAPPRHNLKLGVKKVNDDWHMQDDGEARHIELKDNEALYIDDSNSEIFIK